VNSFLIYGALATLVGASVAPAAFADIAETQRGNLVKADDGRSLARLSGAIHFDGNLVSEDTDARFGSPANPAQSGLFVRRILLSVTGKLNGWNYKIEPDFASDNSTGATEIAFQDVFLATRLGRGQIQIGQRKPFRAMEDLTSSNEILMIERPFTSSAGLFGGGLAREFGLGLFYRGNIDNFSWGVGGYSLRAINTPGTEGVGASARATYAPLASDGENLHFGLSISYENPVNNQGATPSTTPVNIGTAVSYAGRRGPTAVVGLTSGSKPATTAGFEYASAFGPFFAQAEFMAQHLEQTGAVANQTVLAYYVQGSFFLSGETKPYNKKDGVFQSPRPNGAGGAWELTARYDAAINRDAPAVGGGCGGSVFADQCEVRATTIGTNYYVNPSVRFMLNYVLGEQDRGRDGKDQPRTLAARAQLSF
jgi:phosphate-selective porin OprO/OprP